MKSILAILPSLSMILVPITTAGGVNLLLAPTAHAQSNGKRCATRSCNGELSKIEGEQSTTRLQIQAADIKIASIGKQQSTIKSNRVTLEKDIARYNIECLHVTVDTAAQKELLDRECKDRSQDLKQTADKQDDDESKISDLSEQLVRTSIKKDQLQSTEARLESQKMELYSQAITAVLGDLQSRQSASVACKSLENPEQLHCCNSVVWNGAPPAQCGVKLLYTVFDRMSVFSGRSVVPR